MVDLIDRAQSFAREKHAGQFRKGIAKEPYVVHLEDVSSLVAEWGGTKDTIAGAWLHDTIEDCPPTNFDEIASLFGKKIALIVSELTDDKSLPKQKRKDLQITNASKKSPEASIIKLADKTSNVGSLVTSPPENWTLDRRLDYIKWARCVVGELPNLPSRGLQEFENKCDQAELQAYIDLGSERQAQNASLTILERKAKRLGASQEQSDLFLKSLMETSFKN